MKKYGILIWWHMLLLVFIGVGQVTAQTIDLSKPVGATSGTAGTTATGGSTYTVPIKVPDGTNKMVPTVSLVYGSQAGDGIAGFGWNLSCLSMITRAGKNNYYNGITAPVKYTNTNDAFVLEGQRLFATTGANGADGTVYGLEDERYVKVESFGGSETQGPAWFRVTTKDGMVMEYGNATDAKMYTDDGASVMLWLLNKITDINGNYQRYSYGINTTMRTWLLTEIAYTGNTAQGIAPYNKIVFSYGIRDNWQNTAVYEGGASLRKAWGLLRVEVKNAAAQNVRSYDFGYTYSKGLYYLNSITEKGSDGVGLNPLVFNYGSNTTGADLATSLQYPEMHKGNIYAGDFNGDSRQDILSVNYHVDNNGIRNDYSYDVLSNFSEQFGGPSINYFYTYTMPPNGTVQVNSTTNGYQNYLTNDYDGDGKEDVLMVNNTTSGSDQIFAGVRINYSRVYSVYTGAYYETGAYMSIPHSPFYVEDFKYTYRNGSTRGRYFVAGDFDGDGAQDYILILGINYLNAFKAFFSSPRKGIFNQEIVQFGVEGTASDPFYATSVASASQLIPFDFDGDGKHEILVVKGSQSYVLSITPLPPSTGYSYGASVLATTTAIKGDYPVYPGDFNGDGKGDLLYRDVYNNAYGTWNILSSTGKAFVSTPFSWLNRVYLPQDAGGSAHHVMVADLNGDGRTDVWESLDLDEASSKHNVGYSTGQSFVWEVYYAAVSTNGSMSSNTVVGDFNGDGKADMLGINDNSDGRFIYPRPGREDNFLVKATDGLGAQQTFTYGLITDGYGGLYERSWNYLYDVYGTPIGEGVNGNPYNVLFSPLYVVSEKAQSNGLGAGTSYTYYHYKDAIYSRKKGFLGFAAITANDGQTGIASTTEYSIDPTLLVSHPVHQYTYQYPNTLTDTKITDVLQAVGTSYYDKRYVHKVLKVLATDHVKGMATETTNTIDSYGNVTQSVVKTGTVSGEVVTPVETSTVTTVFGTHGTPYPASAESITETKERSGQAAVNAVTALTYDAKGNVLTRTEFSGLPKALTHTFTYDAFGNVTQSQQAAAGMVTRMQQFVYDNTGRWMLQKIAVGSGLNQKTVYTYDAISGQVASQLSPDGLTTTYQYDGLGRLRYTSFPQGYTTSHNYGWETTGGRYYTYDGRSGYHSFTRTTYDILGREVKKENSGFNGNVLTSTKTYDARGQLAAVTAPHYPSEAAVTTSYQYDGLGRTTQVAKAGVTTTYAYAALAGGQYRKTVTDGAGQSSSQTRDAAGKLVTATDNGGTLTYAYDSRGNQVQIMLNGAIATSSEYDAYGRQSQLTDRNSGTLSFEYNALGELVSQTNALGLTTTNTYDALGRVISRTGPEGTTTTQYWQDYTSNNGYNNNKPSVITGFSGEQKVYVYDENQHLVTEVLAADGNAFITFHEYDLVGNLVKTTYPSGVIITREYDDNSIETKVKLGEGASATTLAEATAMNSLGKYTGYTFGSGITGTETYNLATGQPTWFTTNADVLDITYNFDAATGNLLQRKDMNVMNVQEDFTYDNLNRLVSTKVNNVNQLTLTYDGNTGNSLGNILSKTDAGDYVYNSSKVNAVAYITNPAGAITPPAVISQNQLDITYTPFLKTATLAENGYTLNYTYASDYQRYKSELSLNGTLQERKYYMGNYEQQQVLTSGVTRDIHYISGMNGLVAIVVKDASGIQHYYTHCDYQGSIISVTSAYGSLVTIQNFDAWGRKRNGFNWTYNNAGSPAVPDWLYRGYTGHEYLKEFGLINMNGRMYDPVQGRMLSPDNYVQNSLYTQNFNRYSYAYNNPLRYTDPTGDFFIIDSWLIGLFSGGWEEANRRALNDIKIWGGLFAIDGNKSLFGNIGEFFSRLTWQLPQTAGGLLTSHAYNTYGLKGGVESVNYKYGATVVKTRSADTWGGVTQGSYIIGDNTIEADENNALFQHEYGHYLQSQKMGLAYYPRVAIPSLGSDAASHDFHPVEQDANRRAFLYFNKNIRNFQNDANPSDNLGWNFWENPLDVQRVGPASRGQVIDYRNPADLLQLNRLIVSARWFDYSIVSLVISPGEYQ